MCKLAEFKYVYHTYVHFSKINPPKICAAWQLSILLVVNFSYIYIVIINGPLDVTVCSGNSVMIPCGFTGAPPLTTSLNWRIIRRSDDGSVISNETLSINDIINDIDDGLVWDPDTTTGGNNAPNSVLLVGPVDESHNQSSYQCFVNDDESSIGTLTVFGEL